jgi:hypothetical protein
VSHSNEVRIPRKAVSDDTDIREPARNLLEGLNLLGTREETEQAKGFTAAFTGPPQSVALIEAGATAAAKWWSAGLAALLIPLGRAWRVGGPTRGPASRLWSSAGLRSSPRL